MRSKQCKEGRQNYVCQKTKTFRNEVAFELMLRSGQCFSNFFYRVAEIMNDEKINKREQGNAGKDKNGERKIVLYNPVQACIW